MTKKKLLLIGNSAIGKSTCCSRLANNPETASMDKRFGQFYPELEATLKWIISGTDGETILEASAHEELFWDLAHAKQMLDERLKPILFVFLYNSNPGSRWDRLTKSGRKGKEVQTPLAWDALVNDLCHYIADISINTASMEVGEVAGVIKAVSTALCS